MSAPSAGAQNASRRIMSEFVRHGGIAKCGRKDAMDWFAQIIDRETASNELVEALRAIVGTPGVRRVSDDLHEQGLAALAKYEARQ